MPPVTRVATGSRNLTQSVETGRIYKAAIRASPANTGIRGDFRTRPVARLLLCSLKVHAVPS